MGSEMCIRDRLEGTGGCGRIHGRGRRGSRPGGPNQGGFDRPGGCLLYTSDAADERSSVDLGGGRMLKKKKKYKNR